MKLSRAMIIVVAASLTSCGSDDETSEEVASDVGKLCTPELEDDPLFVGFHLRDSTAFRSPQCSDVCLVNHFQGRVSCPTGQEAPSFCTGGAPCPSGQTCGAGPSIGSSCTPGSCPQGFACSDDRDNCFSEICEHEALCRAGDLPVAASICGWCSDRPNFNAVYCSCDCGAGGCSCPDGYACQAFEPRVGTEQLDGSFCVRSGTAYVDEVTSCGDVGGFWGPACEGLPTAP